MSYSNTLLEQNKNKSSSKKENKAQQNIIVQLVDGRQNLLSF
jgi:hypothetical protein